MKATVVKILNNRVLYSYFIIVEGNNFKNPLTIGR